MGDNDYEIISEEASPKRYKISNAIEVPILLIMIGVAVSGIQISNLIMHRTCVHELNRTASECQHFLSPEMTSTPEELSQRQELEREVQEYANKVMTAKSVLESAGPAVLSLFVGAWSDKHGRKPLIVWNLLAMTLGSMALVAYSMVSLGPWWLVACSVFFSLTGGISVVITGAMCFVSDVTDNRNRTFRLVMVQMSLVLGIAGGSMVSPFLLRAVGSVYSLLIVAAIYACAYAFSAVAIQESLSNIEEGSIFSVLDFSHVKDMLTESFKEKPNYGRAKLLLTVGGSTLNAFAMFGTMGLMYLYTRNKLQWTMKDFTTFSALSIVWSLGGFFGVALIQKMFHISDLSFATIAVFSCVVENIIKAGAIDTWQMYLGSAAALFGTVSGPLIRSYLSQTLPSQDIAKVFGLMGSAESFSPLLAPLVYNALYAYTLASFPGAFLVLTAAISTVSLVFLLIVKCLTVKSPSVPYQLVEETDQHIESHSDTDTRHSKME
ncbi:probable peptidoglycan muropeptide transporter SLC46 [Ostrinia nubilalis]|uniref:probable peptidoglycan muropeptide transporter SLC46 n=1 Tax=Ostrinia nubilalis TaxID=29057 RepID=UPI0030825062